MLSHISNKMVSYIYVLCLHMELIVFGDRNGQLVIAIEGDWLQEGSSNFSEKHLDPQCFLCYVSPQCT